MKPSRNPQWNPKETLHDTLNKTTNEALNKTLNETLNETLNDTLNESLKNPQETHMNVWSTKNVANTMQMRGWHVKMWQIPCKMEGEHGQM